MLISEGPMAVKGSVEVLDIPLNKIKLGKNSRSTVSDDEIAGMMASIKENGLLQPIGVVKSKTTGYEIVYGNRRFLAVSKLGYSKISCVIKNNKDEKENDIQNLTENIQRRNITLTEAGRYMKLLSDQGLNPKEIAARIGVANGYVESCLRAWEDVPKKFHDKLVVKTTNDRSRIPGKITITDSRAITSASKTYALKPDQRDFLFLESMSNPEFKTENIKKYAAALSEGSKDPVKDTPQVRNIQVRGWISEKEESRLEKKYITKGPFNSMGAVLIAILRGEISERVEITR
jgi:ParB/RepB/Spo0J family partition protein